MLKRPRPEDKELDSLANYGKSDPYRRLWAKAVVGWLLLFVIVVGVGVLFSTRAPTRTSSHSQNHYAPADHPTAVCSDGTVSYSSSRRGTCSYHGGVDQWLR